MKERDRGRGRAYLRGQTFWIAYSFRGNVIRESAGTTDEKKAIKFLDRRLKERDGPGLFIGPKEEKWTLDDVEAKIRAQYIRDENRSLDSVERRFKHLKRFFPFHRVVDITTAEIEKYQQARLNEGAERSTVNRECAYLRHGMRLMLDCGEISRIPKFKLLEGENIRQGFLTVARFHDLLENLSGSDNKDLVSFLYHSGWRKGEAQKLEWSQVDTQENIIKLPPEKSKNKKPRLLPLTGELMEIIQRRVELRRLDCPFVFHRKGRRIKRFDKAFKVAAVAIGQPDLIPHDMRRSAVRNFRKAGLSETEAKLLSGHRTNSVFERYNIVDEDDLRESMARAQEYHKRAAAERKVIPLKRPA